MTARLTNDKAVFLVGVGLLFATGCGGGGGGTGTSESAVATKSTKRVTLDARGGETNSDLLFGQRDEQEGFGGQGGEIRVTASRGDIDVTTGPAVSAPQAAVFAGVGLNVLPGEKRVVAGDFVVDFLRVQQGGTLVLADNTFFVVLGDVEIAGKVVSRRRENGIIDGRDFSIDADGVINIAGTIDVSGADGDDEFDATDPGSAGGNGGSIYLSSVESLLASPGPHIFISGTLVAEGGDTFSREGGSSRPGNGGQILIGSLGTITITGSVSVSAGFANDHGGFPERASTGGEIQLVALEGIELALVTGINANGGKSTGNFGGDGGRILFEAAGGTIRLDGVSVRCQGGDATFKEAAQAGDGGILTITGDIIDLAGVTCDASGGDAPGSESEEGIPVDGAQTGGLLGGEGGDGGTIQIAGLTALDVNAATTLLADGGLSNQTTVEGGPGGAASILNLDELDLTVMTFRGRVSVVGGIDDLGSLGPDGRVCERGADDASAIAITGATDFPVALCVSSDVTDFLVHDLDCDDATINPDEMVSEVPAVTGVDFFRIHPGLATSMTITLGGEGGTTGELSLFAGDDTAFGSLLAADYAFMSVEPGNNESISIDFTAFAPGQFVSVMVREESHHVSGFSLKITCALP